MIVACAAWLELLKAAYACSMLLEDDGGRAEYRRQQTRAAQRHRLRFRIPNRYEIVIECSSLSLHDAFLRDVLLRQAGGWYGVTRP